MGPSVLFDKSALQALSLDEAVLFDHFFQTVICPIFYAEVLADLKKKPKGDRSPEKEVEIIASKAPEIHSYPNVHHVELCIANLHGYPIEMDRRPVMAGAKPVKSGDRSGVKFEVSPEARAFNRWQDREFFQLEKELASGWRTMLENLDLKGIVSALKDANILPEKCSSLVDAKSFAEEAVERPDWTHNFLRLIPKLLGLGRNLPAAVWDRADAEGRLGLVSLAPYAAHVVKTELFFYAALDSGQISTDRASNKIDFAYLYYLPFAEVFVSGDKLHRRCAPMLMQEDQEFLWAPDLKNDLKALDKHYGNLPQAERDKGLFAIAQGPPNSDIFLVARLWNRYRPGWSNRRDIGRPKNREAERRLVDQLKKFGKSKRLKRKDIDFDPANPENVIIERRVHKSRGKWRQLPPEATDSDNDD